MFQFNLVHILAKCNLFSLLRISRYDIGTVFIFNPLHLKYVEVCGVNLETRVKQSASSFICAVLITHMLTVSCVFQLSPQLRRLSFPV